MFNWEKLFQNKNIHDQLKSFNETIVNIVSNYISNKFIICNEKDPPWLNYHIKRLINLKNEIFKKYLKDRRPDLILWDGYVYFIRFFKAKSLIISIALFHPWEPPQDHQIHLLLFIVGPSIFKTLFYLTS